MAIINGTSGDDQSAATNGTPQSDIITLFAGDDQTRPGDGADTVYGGDGRDRVSYVDSDAGVNVNLVSGNGSGGFAAGDRLFSVEDIFASAFNDVLTGTSGNNLLDGFNGNDTIFAGSGSDTVIGGDGTDRLFGSDGNDQLFGGDGVDFLFGDTSTGVGNDILIGGAGADFLFGGAGDDALAGGAGADSISGGDGIDVLSYFNSASAVNVSIVDGTASGGDAAGDTFSGIEGLEGSENNDRLTGNSASNDLFGGEGADFLDGRGGADSMRGGLGNDFYVVDNTGDVILDEVTFSAGGGIDTVRAFINYVQPTNIELVRLGNIDGTGNLNVTGNSAPGTLVGNAGNNTMIGGFSNNQINGNAGDDTITGGNGRDTMVGGSGADTFVYNNVSDSDAGTANRDFINGFSNGSDRIDLRGVDANENTGADNAFTFIGSTGFSGSAGELRLQGLGGANAVLVEADTDGNGQADMQIFVNLTTTMSASDFLL